MLTVSLAFFARTLAARLLHENDVSYGLNIYHMPVVNLPLANHLFGAAKIPIFLGSTLLLAILSWRVIEKPALSLKDYSLLASNRGRGPSPTVASNSR
jgi:peptidoglycan/LPS O-acetylase OafA/YrhL